MHLVPPTVDTFFLSRFDSTKNIFSMNKKAYLSTMLFAHTSLLLE